MHFLSFGIHNSMSVECRNPSLGLVTKARVCEGVAKSEARESHFMLSGVWENVRE